MTSNAFLFSWNMHGIESIVPITQYEFFEENNLIKILSEKEAEKRNPLNSIIQQLLLRARFNTQRQYEVYAIDCPEEMDEVFWYKQWDDFPQETAETIRERGHRLYSDRTEKIK